MIAHAQDFAFYSYVSGRIQIGRVPYSQRDSVPKRNGTGVPTKFVTPNLTVNFLWECTAGSHGMHRLGSCHVSAPGHHAAHVLGTPSVTAIASHASGALELPEPSVLLTSTIR